MCLSGTALSHHESIAQLETLDFAQGLQLVPQRHGSVPQACACQPSSNL